MSTPGHCGSLPVDTIRAYLAQGEKPAAIALRAGVSRGTLSGFMKRHGIRKPIKKDTTR